MGEPERGFVPILEFATILTGAIGIITIPLMIAELYLYYSLEKFGKDFNFEGILGGFAALNTFFAVLMWGSEGYSDFLIGTTIISVVIATVFLLLFAIYVELLRS